MPRPRVESSLVGSLGNRKTGEGHGAAGRLGQGLQTLVRDDHFVLNAVGNWMGSVWLLYAESGQGL